MKFSQTPASFKPVTVFLTNLEDVKAVHTALAVCHDNYTDDDKFSASQLHDLSEMRKYLANVIKDNE